MIFRSLVKIGLRVDNVNCKSAEGHRVKSSDHTLVFTHDVGGGDDGTFVRLPRVAIPEVTSEV